MTFARRELVGGACFAGQASTRAAVRCFGEDIPSLPCKTAESQPILQSTLQSRNGRPTEIHLKSECSTCDPGVSLLNSVGNVASSSKPEFQLVAHMFAFIGNRGDLAKQILERHRPLLAIERGPREALGWGIGFYQSGEVLLRRRPIDERGQLNLADAVESIRTDALIGHVRHATTGPLRTENTHPFRYRLWLFAHTGAISGFARLRERLLSSLPTFLRRNVRGDTDSEVFFYLFLSFLHDAGHLEEIRPQARSVTGALRATISLIDRYSAEEGFGPNSGDVIVANGEDLFAVNRDGNMKTMELDGRLGVEELLSGVADANLRIPSIESTHLSLVAAGLPANGAEWTPVESRSIVTFSRAHAPHIEPL